MFVCVQKVVHGKYNGTVDVAIKMPKEGMVSEKEFIAEANTMTSVLSSCCKWFTLTISKSVSKSVHL